MEREYLNYLMFLKHHESESVNKLYPYIRTFCLNLKDRPELALSRLKLFINGLFEIIDKFSLSKEDIALVDYFLNIDETTQFSDELYQKELSLLNMFIHVCTDKLGRTRYIDYFKCLKPYPNIYEKIDKCIKSYKIDPVTAVDELRTGIVNFCKKVFKDKNISVPVGTGENKAAISKLVELGMIDTTEENILHKLITYRNTLLYDDSNKQHKVIKTINGNSNKKKNASSGDKEIMGIREYVKILLKSIQIFYKVVNEYFNTCEKGYLFPEQYFPIGDSEVLYALGNTEKQFGQHEYTYYLKRPGAYGFDQEGIVREYINLEIDNNLDHNRAGLYIIQNIINEEDRKYFLTEFVIPTAATSYYKYIGYHRVDGYYPLEFAINLNSKQATQVILQIGYALRALRKATPVIYHRNLTLQTILFNDSEPDNIKIKIGYFEMIKLNKEVPTVSDKISKNIFLPPEVSHNAFSPDENYDWSLFDIYSMGIIYIYLLLHKEIKIPEVDYVDEISDLLEDEGVDDEIKSLIIGMIDVPINRYTLDECIEKLEDIYGEY